MKYRLTILKCFTIFVFFVSLALLYACQGNDETSDPIEKLIGMNQSENFHTNRLVDKETPYTFVFENNGSTKSLYIFTSPIGYYDLSERLQLIDTTLVSVTDLGMKKKGYNLETKSCDIVSYFPKRISKAPFLIQGKDSFLSFVPSDELAVENLSKSTFTDLTGRRNSSAVYQKDGNIRLEYVSTTSGIMVNVNVEEKPENNQLDFYIDKQEETDYFINDNKYVVFKTTGNESVIKAIIYTSFLQDSLGACSFENTVNITPTEDQWKYSIILDESFLNDPDTQYPITISPTFELYRNKMPDSSVYSKKSSTNIYLANYTVMGNNDFFGDSQHYLRFGINYIFKSYAQNVKSAVYVSTAISRDLEPMSIEMHRMKDLWISTAVNWDTKYPTYSKESTTQISTPGRYEFDITEFVKLSIQDDEWNTEVYGLAMTAVEGSKGAKAIATSDNTFYQPYIRIDFYDLPWTFERIYEINSDSGS